MLRYQRMPAGLVREIGLPAHRALPDAYVTAHHLRDLLDEHPIETLLMWSREPGLLPRVRGGPWRGRSWAQLSDQALRELAADGDVDTRFSASVELRRREGEQPAAAPEQAQPSLL